MNGCWVVVSASDSLRHTSFADFFANLTQTYKHTLLQHNQQRRFWWIRLYLSHKRRQQSAEGKRWSCGEFGVYSSISVMAGQRLAYLQKREKKYCIRVTFNSWLGLSVYDCTSMSKIMHVYAMRYCKFSDEHLTWDKASKLPYKLTAIVDDFFGILLCINKCDRIA